MANKEIDYKARAERGMKIQSVYRDLQELKKLEAELDSAKAKYDTPEKSNAYRVKINSEIKKAKAKLKTNSDAIINSGDKDLIKEYNDGLKDDAGKELTSALSTTSTSTKNNTMAKTEDKTKGTIMLDPGARYTGELKDGKPHGQGTLDFLPTGDKYVGEFKDGKENGQGTFTWPDGDKHVGEYKDGERNGQGTYTRANGEKYVGQYKNDKRNGQGTNTFPDGEKYVGEYKDDKRNGPGTETYKDGEKYVGEFKDDKRVKPTNEEKPETKEEESTDEGLTKEGMTDAELEKLKEEYSNDKYDVEVYEITNKDFDKNTAEYKKYQIAKDRLKSNSIKIVQQTNEAKASELEARIAQAKSDRLPIADITAIQEEKDSFEKGRFDFNKKAANFTKMGELRNITPDVDYGELASQTDNIIKDDGIKAQEEEKEEEAYETPIVEDGPSSKNGGQGGGQGGQGGSVTRSGPGGSTAGSNSNVIEDRRKEAPKTDSQGNPIATISDADLLKRYEKELSELETAKSNQSQLGEYAPDSQSDSDVLGSLMDVGRTAVGMIGATKEIPEYERGSMWNKAMDGADRRSEEGLTADERNYRNQQSETAYAYNVKNIRKGAAGSSGAYLGNIQSAAAGLYGDYGKTAAIDEELRRESRANFQSMATKDEAINSQTFQNELSQAITSKQQGAALVGDAINNIKEKSDYKKAYGKDSANYAYDKAITQKTELDMLTSQDARKNAVNTPINELQTKIQELQEKTGDTNQLGNVNNEKRVIETANKTTPGSDESSNPPDVFGSTGTPLVNSVNEQTDVDGVTKTGTSPKKIEEVSNNEEKIITDETLPVSKEKTDVGEGTGEDNFDPKKFTGTNSIDALVKTGKVKKDDDGKLVSTVEPTKESNDVPFTITDKDGNVRKFDSKSEAKISQAQTFKKDISKNYKAEIKQLQESIKYGGTKEELDRIKLLKKKLKEGKMTDEDMKKFDKMLKGSGVTAKDLEGAK